MSRALPFVSSFAFRDARGIASLGEDVCLIFFYGGAPPKKQDGKKAERNPRVGWGWSNIDSTNFL